VLADSIGRATINLRIYFWLNGREHSWLKVRSSVIRLVKRAFQEHSISMPDEAREVVFPKGVPVTMLEAEKEKASAEPTTRKLLVKPDPGSAVVSTQAEAGLYSEAGVIEDQARKVQPLKKEENLLQPSIEAPSSKSGTSKAPGET